jgi:hypothetical protein
LNIRVTDIIMSFLNNIPRIGVVSYLNLGPTIYQPTRGDFKTLSAAEV